MENDSGQRNPFLTSASTACFTNSYRLSSGVVDGCVESHRDVMTDFSVTQWELMAGTRRFARQFDLL
jgi:hypothetical protein